MRDGATSREPPPEGLRLEGLSIEPGRVSISASSAYGVEQVRRRGFADPGPAAS